MPQKIRQLKASLKKAGFYVRPGKGSHTVWYHPEIPGFTIAISGKDGNDAKPYQMDDVEDALKRLRRSK